MSSQKLKLDQFEMLQTVGTGSFGRVRIAKNKKTNEFVAMKILKKGEILRLKQVDHIISEHTILANISHPFLIGLKGYA